MSRLVRRVDRAILAWMSERAEAERLLAVIEHRFRDMSGKTGHVLSSSALTVLLDGDEALTSLQVTEMGTLTGKITDENGDRTIDWDSGDLSIWRGSEILPQTMVAQLPGRRLGEVISHRWAPANALIVDVADKGLWLTLQCQEFSTTIEDAREMLAGMNTEVEGKKTR